MRSLRKEWWSAGLLLVLIVQMQSLYADSGEHQNSSNPNHRTVRTNKTVRVIIWAREVGKGAAVQSEDFEQMQMPVSKCPVDAIDDTSFAEGRITIRDIKKGDAIRLRDFGINMLPNSPARTTYLGREDIPLPVLYAGSH